MVRCYRKPDGHVRWPVHCVPYFKRQSCSKITFTQRRRNLEVAAGHYINTSTGHFPQKCAQLAFLTFAVQSSEALSQRSLRLCVNFKSKIVTDLQRDRHEME